MTANIPLTDVNITLGRWPTRRVPLDDPQRLVAKLREHNVVEAWAGSYDGLFQEDLTAVNNRLAAECRRQTAVRLVPFGEINPLLPGWLAELRRCAEHHRMPGVRLHPNYHGYALDHPQVVRVLKVAAQRNLIVALTPLMEDDRMMHSLLRVPPTDLTPLTDLVRQTPGLKLLLLNMLKSPRADHLHHLLAAGEVYFDIAMFEGVAALAQLLTEVSHERILFGSHAPTFYFESAKLKLKESPLPAAHLRAIGHDNARRLLPKM